MQSIEWRFIRGFEGYYEISSDGHVRSVPRTVVRSDGRVFHYVSRELAIRRDKFTGYFRFTLTKDNRTHKMTLHRVLAETFIPNPNGYGYVLHGDGDQTNNSLSNLRWGSQSDNMYDNVKHGGNANAEKTHCKHGHELTPENMYANHRNGRTYRRCKTCTDAINARYRATRPK